MVNEWQDPEHVAAYFQRKDNMSQREAGEATLLAEAPVDCRRVLDLGCGDGHLLDCVLSQCPNAAGVGLDFSPAMLEKARSRFASNPRVTLVEHDLDHRLPDLGPFDCVVSSFAIHHCEDQRKREIYDEVYSLLEPGGVFCNLEHVSSPTPRLHQRFMSAIGLTPADEDPSNKLLDVGTQLTWLRQIGFEHVECLWKWRELALIVGLRPRSTSAAHDSNDPGSRVPPFDVSPTRDEMIWLEYQLEKFNREQVGADSFESVNLVTRGDGGRVVAGLKAMTGWRWLYVQCLWVDANHRRTGIGHQLLQRAEADAIHRGCIGACLASYSFQAPDFYIKCGYQVVGHIDDYPPGNTMYFLTKQFASAS